MIGLIANILTGVVALIHVYILVLEMYLWTKPIGLKVFRQSLAQAEASKILAANQGLYNGFLASGLVLGVIAPMPEVALQFKIFFLMCVIVAGIYGGVTVGRKILFVQAVPAALALAFVLAPLAL